SSRRDGTGVVGRGCWRWLRGPHPGCRAFRPMPTRPVRREGRRAGPTQPGRRRSPQAPPQAPPPVPPPAPKKAPQEPPPVAIDAVPGKPAREAGGRPLLGSVVKVLTISDAPDYEQPWQTHGAQASTGSGAVIATERGLRVLTNAHVVMNQVFVEVRRSGSSKKFTAKVEAVVHECDLALLAVKDATFFEGATPVELGELPHLGDRV